MDTEIHAQQYVEQQWANLPTTLDVVDASDQPERLAALIADTFNTDEMEALRTALAAEILREKLKPGSLARIDLPPSRQNPVSVTDQERLRLHGQIVKVIHFYVDLPDAVLVEVTHGEDKGLEFRLCRDWLISL